MHELYLGKCAENVSKPNFIHSRNKQTTVKEYKCSLFVALFLDVNNRRVKTETSTKVLVLHDR